MPIKVGVYFEKKNVSQIIDSLQTLPVHLQPIYFSEEETLKSKKDEVADKKRFEKFIAQNPAGFFLFSDGCSYNLFMHDRGHSRLFCDVEDAKSYSDIPLLFEAVATYVNTLMVCSPEGQ